MRDLENDGAYNLFEADDNVPKHSLYGPFQYGGSPFWKRMAALCILAALSFIVLSWIPWCGGGRGRNASALEVIIAALLTTLQGMSYIQAVVVNPGEVTAELHDWLLANTPKDALKFCERCQLAKPKRSHFDNVSQRLVLNMDHFCPWVGNTIGFHNRKFFMLLLLYTGLSASFLGLTTVGCLGHSSSFMIGMFVIDMLIGISAIVFGLFHLKMVLRNETTIEVKYSKHLQQVYDVGMLANFRQVFGQKVWLWLLPVYGAGPEGDGVHWPTSGRGYSDSIESYSEEHLSPYVVEPPVSTFDEPSGVSIL